MNMYFLENVKYWLQDNAGLFLIGGILLVPTAVYYTIQKAGYIPPFWISSIAIRNVWGIAAIVGGIFIGAIINKSTER